MTSRGAAVAAALATATGPSPARADRLPAAVTEDAGIAWDEHGTIVYAGPAGGLPWAATVGDASRGCLVPGFVDCHVHLPFAGWRADEFEARLRGAAYADLHGEAGGSSGPRGSSLQRATTRCSSSAGRSWPRW